MSTSLRLESIQLHVPDVRKSAEFYRRKIGFVLLRATDSEAELGVTEGGPGLLRLTTTRQPPAPRDCAGLFHAALLFPDRPSLADWLKFAAGQNVEFDGLSDHGVSEAIYCSDPDGNGLEFYADRPRETWPFANGQLAMDTRALDLRSLLAEPPANRKPVLAGARWGHLHLRVTQLDRSADFYGDALRMETTQRTYPGARFMAADGYHHHLGLNTWGNPRRPHPAGAAGLAEATFAVAKVSAETSVVDPDGMSVRLVPLTGR